MIEVFDRVTNTPGRVKLTPVEGQANTWDMVRADNPSHPGTPINRALFLSISNDIEAMRQQLDDKIFELTQRVRVGDLTEGTEFGLYENGVLVPFIKIASSYMDVNAPLVIRKNCVVSAPLVDPGETYYDGCRTDRWLNTTYLAQLDAATQSVIKNTNVETSTYSGLGAITRKIFLPSLYEYYMTSNTGISIENNLIYYFSSPAKRVAMLNGSPVNHWTRSIDRYRDTAAYVTTSGEHEIVSSSLVSAGVRPMFMLPADFEVTVGIPKTANTVATAEAI